jgi:hypothetical protein
MQATWMRRYVTMYLIGIDSKHFLNWLESQIEPADVTARYPRARSLKSLAILALRTDDIWLGNSTDRDGFPNCIGEKIGLDPAYSRPDGSETALSSMTQSSPDFAPSDELDIVLCE